MQFKKSCGRIFGVKFTSAEKRALDLEISRQIAESDIRHADDVDAMMLYKYTWVLVKNDYEGSMTLLSWSTNV